MYLLSNFGYTNYLKMVLLDQNILLYRCFLCVWMKILSRKLITSDRIFSLAIMSHISSVQFSALSQFPRQNPVSGRGNIKETAMACTKNPISQMIWSYSLHQLKESCSHGNRYPFNLSSSYGHRYLWLPGERGGGMTRSDLWFYYWVRHSAMSQLGGAAALSFPHTPFSPLGSLGSWQAVHSVYLS